MYCSPSCTQLDMPYRDIPGIGFARLTKMDIVRHRLVQDIVLAYEEEADEEGRRARRH